MASSSDKRLYRVIFMNQGKVFEVFAREVSQGGLFGFVEIEQIVFGETSAVLVDPNEDSLRKEFENTKRSFIPMHSVIRIDEMEKDASLKPRVVALNPEAAGNGGSNITPIYTPQNPNGGQ